MALKGQTGRERETIGFGDGPAGDVVGDHTVLLFATEGEDLRCPNQPQRPQAANDLAKTQFAFSLWLTRVEPGRYDMQDDVGAERT